MTWWRHQMETFSALLAICAGNSPVPGEFPPHKGQWRGALMFTLICARINGWVNNREAGDLRRYRTHYDVIVMTPQILKMIGNSINHPLVYMINISFQQGIFPKEHNIANVLPLFKANLYSIITAPCLCYVYCQRSMRRLCIIVWPDSWKISIYFLKINLDLFLLHGTCGSHR